MVFDPIAVAAAQAAKARQILPGISTEATLFTAGRVNRFMGSMFDWDANVEETGIPMALDIPEANGVYLTGLTVVKQPKKSSPDELQLVISGTGFMKATMAFVLPDDSLSPYPIRSELVGKALSFSWVKFTADESVTEAFVEYLETEHGWTTPFTTLPQPTQAEQDTARRWTLWNLASPVPNEAGKGFRGAYRYRIEAGALNGPFISSMEVGSNIPPNNPTDGFHNFLYNFAKSERESIDRAEDTANPVRQAAANSQYGSITGSTEAAETIRDGKPVVPVYSQSCAIGRLEIDGHKFDLWGTGSGEGGSPAAPAPTPTVAPAGAIATVESPV